MIKKIFLIVSLNCLMSNGQIDPEIYAESITSEELKGLLYTYASDYFSGRDTGTKGQKIAIGGGSPDLGGTRREGEKVIK